MDWQNQRCLLTGASGGIGQAIARELAARGVSLILQGRNLEKLQALHNTLPGNHYYVVADITSQQGRDSLVERVSQLGGISMLINNAGMNQVGLFEEYDQQVISDTINTNLLGPMLITRALLAQLKNGQPAWLVNIGSAFGSIGFAGQSVYCASKFGLRGFTEALYRELADSKVKVCYLAPRATETAINPANVVKMNQQLGNKMDPPLVVAQALIKQLESGQARVAIGFAERFFARINHLFPRVVDNALFKKLPIIKQFVTHPTSELPA